MSGTLATSWLPSKCFALCALWSPGERTPRSIYAHCGQEPKRGNVRVKLALTPAFSPGERGETFGCGGFERARLAGHIPAGRGPARRGEEGTFGCAWSKRVRFGGVLGGAWCSSSISGLEDVEGFDDGAGGRRGGLLGAGDGEVLEADDGAGGDFAGDLIVGTHAEEGAALEDGTVCRFEGLAISEDHVARRANPQQGHDLLRDAFIDGVTNAAVIRVIGGRSGQVR